MPAAEAIDRGVIVGAKPGLVSGSVNATSIDLTAEYDVKLSLNFGSRAFNAATTIHIKNTSGAPIDRLELNTIAARLGSMKLGKVTSEGKAVAARVHDQTIHVPLGGILGPGQSVDVTVAYSATLRSSTQRLELAVHADERHRRRPSLDPVDQPRRAVRPAEPRRPVHHPGQPAGPRRDHERSDARVRLDRRARRRRAV